MRFFNELTEEKKNKLKILLIDVGILPRYKGYDLMKDAVAIRVKGVSKMDIIRELVAEEHGITTSCAEKNFRRVIAFASTRKKLRKLNNYYGAEVVENDYCTTKEFIGLIAELIKEKA